MDFIRFYINFAYSIRIAFFIAKVWRIGGKGGIILFPDGVTIAENEVYQAKGINSATSFDQDGSSFLCTPAQWAALEAKGCVFLPLTGFRM